MNNRYPNLIMRFLSYKLTIQNCSRLTVEEYGRDLAMFFGFIIGSRGEVNPSDVVLTNQNTNEELAASVHTDEVYSYLLYLMTDRRNNAATRARKLSAIKSFYKFHTVKVHTFKNNPVKDIDSPSVKQALPKYLSLNESKALLKAVKNSSPYPERDYCILMLFLNCGMRLSELVGIDLPHIAYEYQKLQVTGKGNKTRIIYLNKACRDALCAYIAVRQQNAAKYGKPIKEDSKDALFLSERNQRISAKTVQWLVKKYIETAGLGDLGYSTHKLRHTAATLMYNSGKVDVLTIKEILGHEQLNTTQIYTHVSDKSLESAMEQNPLANIEDEND